MIENSKSNHLGAQGTFNPTGSFGRCSFGGLGCCSCRVRACVGVGGVVLCRCVYVTCWSFYKRCRFLFFIFSDGEDSDWCWRRSQQNRKWVIRPCLSFLFLTDSCLRIIRVSSFFNRDWLLRDVRVIPSSPVLSVLNRLVREDVGAGPFSSTGWSVTFGLTKVNPFFLF